MKKKKLIEKLNKAAYVFSCSGFTHINGNSKQRRRIKKIATIYGY